jgi:hypothetical protein
MRETLPKFKESRLQKKKSKSETEDKNLENDPRHIEKLWKTYSFQLASATSRRERIENLLSRNSVNKLPLERKQRLTKRLAVACKEQEEAVSFVEQIRYLMERLNLLK